MSYWRAIGGEAVIQAHIQNDALQPNVKTQRFDQSPWGSRILSVGVGIVVNFMRIKKMTYFSVHLPAAAQL